MDASMFEKWERIKDDLSLDELRDVAKLLVASFDVYGDPHSWENFESVNWNTREMLSTNFTVWTAPPSEPSEKEPWQ